jgi:hypothetical protein
MLQFNITVRYLYYDCDLCCSLISLHVTSITVTCVSGQRVHEVLCESQMFAVSWHPRQYLLAFACDDKHKCDRSRGAGTVKLSGLPSDSSW